MSELKRIVAALDTIAPLANAEAWDNVGLLWGDESQAVERVLVCIDYTEAVAREAREQAAQLVIAYHPAIFSGMKRVPGQSLVYRAIRDGIALYSPHTALDVAAGGTNDVLADACGLAKRQPLRPLRAEDRFKKLITFVPEASVQHVSEALFSAGAGTIGNYSGCSFRSAGHGTFFGEEGAAPQVGQAGRREVVPEVRIETVVPNTAVSAVLSALIEAHPYETPAFDLVHLSEPPAALGIGRIGPSALERAEVVARIKAELGLPHVLVAGSLRGKAKRIAVAAGAGAELLDDAIRQKADMFITGELKHHDALKANARGVSVVCTLHSNSERKALSAYRERLLAACPELTVNESRADRDPFAIH